jgi:predicted GIY-YIG superfamily endonuclease
VLEILGVDCWIYVFEIVEAGIFYIGLTRDLATRIKAHKKIHGNETTFGKDIMNFIESEKYQCDNAIEVEQQKILEYSSKYGKDRVIGYSELDTKQKPEPGTDEKQTLTMWIHEADPAECLYICNECIHYDDFDHWCTLLNAVAISTTTCLFWSTGQWGESIEQIGEFAEQQVISWFSQETEVAIRSLFAEGKNLDEIRSIIFPLLDVRKPYSAFRMQKKRVDNFVLKTLRCKDWNEYHKARAKICDST